VDQAIAYLKQLPHTEVKPGLDRIRFLLEAVDNPHEQLQAVHIAGTNGKGSVAAMLSNILHCAGYRVGLYTSPHLVSHCERMQIDQTPVSEQTFAALADELMPIVDSMADKPTQFEFLTAMAFLYFARQKIDIAVVEVGLGGRFDATNIIVPMVSVLTNVELDHTDLLGDTIEKIAWEKAGIARKDISLVTGEYKRGALAVIERECATVGAPLIQARQRVRRLDFTWEYQEFEIESLGRVRLQLLGGYQRENLDIALEALYALRKSFDISQNAIVAGLEQTRWPGRFEIVQQGPYIILLDGAHNPAGSRALREDVHRYRQKYNPRRSFLLFGVFKDKDYRTMGEVLFPEFNEIFLVRLDSPRSCDPDILAEIAYGLGCQASVYKDVKSGLEAAQGRLTPGDWLCITGQIYLIGAVKQALGCQ
jgi:dihydrofolate synthase/folylpolyglutamate synthase